MFCLFISNKHLYIYKNKNKHYGLHQNIRQKFKKCRGKNN